MSTHNIGFYEDLTKISLNYHQVSSNTHLISSAEPVTVYSFSRQQQREKYSTDCFLTYRCGKKICAIMTSASSRENLSSGFPNRSDTNSAEQSQKIAGLKFRN